MSQIQIDDIDLHYESYGDKGKPVILLHGWGQNTEMMAFIGEFLKSHFIVYNLDMPGFGKSGDPKEAWGSFDYCQFLRHFCETMQIEDPIIIGHSFEYKEELMKNAGSEDYRNSSGVMRQTFVKIVNEDLKDLLKDVKAETLLVFGENDEATPVEKGKMMEKLMPDAALVIFENDDHYAYFHQPQRFCLVLDAFLRRDYE